MDTVHKSDTVFVREGNGQVSGPLTRSDLESRIRSGTLQGGVHLSRDGRRFESPDLFPQWREQIPRELWPEEESPKPVAGGVPMAGPGAIAAARNSGVRVPSRPGVAAAAPTAHTATTQMSLLGTFAGCSPVRLYYLAAAHDETGLLKLQLSDRTLDLHFRKGNPEYVGSDHPEDGIGAYLLRSGMINADQAAKAEAAAPRFGGELVGALFGLGLVNPGAAFPVLAQRAVSLLGRALLAEEGSYSFEPVALAAHRAMPLGNRWAVLSDVVRRVPVGELRRRLKPVFDLPVQRSGGRVPVTELKLNPQEVRAFGQMNGVHSLHQLVFQFPQDADHFLRAAFLLQELEVVAYASTPLPPPSAPDLPVDEQPPYAPVSAEFVPDPAPDPVDRTASVAEAPPRVVPAVPVYVPPVVPAGPVAPVFVAPIVSPEPVAPVYVVPTVPAGAAAPVFVAPSAAPSAARAAAPEMAPGVGATRAPVSRPAPSAPEKPRSPDALRAELKALKELVEKQKTLDHFAVLGIKDTADAAAVKVAYFKAAKIHHPDTVPPGSPPGFAKLKEEIFGRIGQAYRTLSDEKSRADYLDELKYGGGTAVDVVSLLHAEETFQRGCLLVKAHRFPEAIKLFDEAIAGNANEGEFYAWRGYARFFTVADKKQGQLSAKKDLDLCLKKNERCAPAYYFLGHIARLVGDNAGATKHFHRCLELQPDNVDALRELRLLKK